MCFLLHLFCPQCVLLDFLVDVGVLNSQHHQPYTSQKVEKPTLKRRLSSPPIDSMPRWFSAATTEVTKERERELKPRNRDLRICLKHLGIRRSSRFVWDFYGVTFRSSLMNKNDTVGISWLTRSILWANVFFCVWPAGAAWDCSNAEAYTGGWYIAKRPGCGLRWQQ